MLMKRNIIPGPFKRTTTRTALSLILLFIIMFILLFYLAQNYRNNLIDFRKAELKRQVEISLNTIQPIIEELKKGILTKDDALIQAVTLVRRMTYTSETMKNYIFMSSYEGMMLVQPLEPWKQDTYQLNARDSYGNYYIKELIATARSEKGEGFVSYFYPPPGARTPGEKLSYVRGIQELDCYIGTGMFFDDIDNLFRQYLLGPMIIIIIGFASICLLIIIYMRPLFRCFYYLLDTVHHISQNPDRVPEVPVHYFPEDSDEYEILCGFSEMISTVGKSREELKNSEEKYRYLYEESLGVRIIIDKNGVVSGANSSFLRTMAFTQSEFNGKNLSDIFEPGQDEKINRMITNAFSGGCSEALDFDLKDAGGNNRTILISDILEIPEDQNKVLMTGVDITNRKIAERRAEIQKEQLIQADKFASLGVLVSGVAHEINNPNQFILSNAGLLEDIWKDCVSVLGEYYDENGDFLIHGWNYSEIKDHIPDYLKSMTEGARRIDKIVSDLKTLSRNDSEQPWSRVDINRTIESAVNLCSNMIKKATDDFVLRLEESLPEVFGNAQQLEQVFINLIQNAVQSLTGRNQQIRIKTSIGSNGGISIVIEDNGCGIKPDDLKKIFDPFYTTKRNSGGTGIGLSISKSIIDKHNGILSYKSEYGKGTVAEVLLRQPGSDTEGDDDVGIS